MDHHDEIVTWTTNSSTAPNGLSGEPQQAASQQN